MLDQKAAALLLQTHKLEALHELKSGKISILLETIDIPTADLVINYDFPRFFFLEQQILLRKLGPCTRRTETDNP
ncbi:hypothetical protein MTR_2g082350 [Medicago truncatula]|uniref:Uncharacterized protein n=1 Tax=Medicago truncatula TaxID=3880 RepID=G7IHB7_MEDTR|nr:hypothetical protein MTR_2g082350 [Medicago truncatula]